MFFTDQKAFLLWEQSSRDTIDVKRVYMRMAGDPMAGMLLSQIIYWHLPSRDGFSKLTVHYKGHYWIRKGRDDWYDEICFSPKNFDTAIKKLIAKKIVEKKVFKSTDAPTTHIRILWENFLPLLKDETEKMDQESREKREQKEQSKSENKPNYMDYLAQQMALPPTIDVDFTDSVNSESPNREITDRPIGKSQIDDEAISTIHRLPSKNTTKSTYKDLNLDQEDLPNIYDYLWSCELPQKIKIKIKMMIQSQKVNLSLEQIDQIENAYHYHTAIGYILPRATIDQTGAINDLEFVATLEKMLIKVKSIDNMQGLIHKWILNAISFKMENAEDRAVSLAAENKEIPAIDEKSNDYDDLTEEQIEIERQKLKQALQDFSRSSALI